MQDFISIPIDMYKHPLKGFLKDISLILGPEIYKL